MAPTHLADDLADGLDYQVDFSDEEAAVPVEEVEPSSKKRKKNPKLQDKKRMKMELDIENKKKLAFEESPEVIADFVNTKLRMKNPNLSALELSDLYLNKSDLRSTNDFDQDRNLDNLSVFLNKKFKNMLPSKKNKVDETDRKFIAILSMSAIRACDIHRALRDIGGASLKLINKNKLNVDLNLVKSTKSRVLCCTPGRLLKVLESEELELKSSEIKIVILDHTYLDKKSQNVLDIKETIPALKQLTESGSKIYLY